MKYKLTIEGSNVAPTWEVIQAMIQSIHNKDCQGRLTRISRLDGGCNYRGIGDYLTEYTPEIGDSFDVLIHVKG